MRLPFYDIDKRYIHDTNVSKRVTFLLKYFYSYCFIYSIIIIRRLDMSTTQGEDDTINVQHVASVCAPNSLVNADDTDVFVLLLHSCYHVNIPYQVTCMRFLKCRVVQ